MTAPAPVWISFPGSWNGGWWAPGCCDNAHRHIAGILRPGKGRFEFDHDHASPIDDVGCFLPDPDFCPWCGSPIPDRVPPNPRPT